MWGKDFVFYAPSERAAFSALEELLSVDDLYADMHHHNLSRMGGLIRKRLSNGLEYQIASFICDMRAGPIYRWLLC